MPDKIVSKTVKEPKLKDLALSFSFGDDSFTVVAEYANDQTSLFSLDMPQATQDAANKFFKAVLKAFKDEHGF